MELPARLPGREDPARDPGARARGVDASEPPDRCQGRYHQQRRQDIGELVDDGERGAVAWERRMRRRGPESRREVVANRQRERDEERSRLWLRSVKRLTRLLLAEIRNQQLV